MDGNNIPVLTELRATDFFNLSRFYFVCYPILQSNESDYPRGDISFFNSYKLDGLTPCLAENNVVALRS